LIILDEISANQFILLIAQKFHLLVLLQNKSINLLPWQLLLFHQQIFHQQSPSFTPLRVSFLHHLPFLLHSHPLHINHVKYLQVKLSLTFSFSPPLASNLFL